MDTPVPSQFSHEILNANPYAYLDDAPIEERRARAVSMRRTLPEAVLTEIGRLDPQAIAQVHQEAWPDVRDADELDDTLQTLVALPENCAAPRGERVGEMWGCFFEELASVGRAARALGEGIAYWVPASQARSFAAIYPSGAFTAEIAPIDTSTPTREEALLKLVRGWMLHSGPIDEAALAGILGLPKPDIQQALLRLEAQGMVLRGRYTDSNETEWCERRLLMRIHRLTLGMLRREIQPVTPAEFMRWLLRWQHLAPGTQVLGQRGALEVIRQLQGFEAPASAWEPQILARRVAAYDPQYLDQLCLAGVVGWGRLSPHPAFSGVPEIDPESASAPARRVTPTSVVPITFFVREDSDWMMPRGAHFDEALASLSHAARDTHNYLNARGASFFADIVRGTKRLKSEVEMALWELVSAGLVTADGFDNLRAFLDPKRRAGQGRGRAARPRNSAGRWSLLFPEEPASRSVPLEAVAKVLLERYGVVFRDLLGRESFPIRWREMLVNLRRLEDRGEVRGGRFIDGFLGEQFALPMAVESLRAARKAPSSSEQVTVSAADPLNLVGIIIPGERVAANSGRTITYRDGAARTEIESPPARILSA